MFSKRKRISKKNRSLISGLLVGLASIYAVASYVNMPRDELWEFFLAAALFVSLVIGLAIAVVVVIKGLGLLKRKLFGKEP